MIRYLDHWATAALHPYWQSRFSLTTPDLGICSCTPVPYVFLVANANSQVRFVCLEAVQARKKLTDVYGEGVLTVRQGQNWFAKFRSGNFDVEDAPRSGRPVEADKDAIKALVDANWRITTREIGLKLNLSNSTIYDHLKGLGLSSKLDLLPDNTTINSEVYCHQLDKLNDALQQKRSELINRKGVVFHQDNARPHTSLVTRQKLFHLEWDTMPHPPYSPDLAPSDYYLYRSLQNFLDGKTFT
ncbi:histone-lysine N-methyltransferase SETMAR [Trichonephila clavipes]|nr:histone-lysine N-methyltransferase SETMAR [Trichonephila clavipes]